MIKIFTIGFTGKSASQFFNLLKDNEVETIIDTRINNTSQLSGFAKGDDLKFFAKEISGMNYFHKIELAPTKDLLSKYRNKSISWSEYEIEYLNLLDIRQVRKKINIESLHNNCFLCSEHTPEKCHRRLLADYLKQHNKDIDIIHLIK